VSSVTNRRAPSASPHIPILADFLFFIFEAALLSLSSFFDRHNIVFILGIVVCSPRNFFAQYTFSFAIVFIYCVYLLS
jgi:hypothetical protein